MKDTPRDIDILCVGETLIDFIGTQVEKPIKETKDYHRYLGGSPTNVAMNMSRLGLNVKMVSTVGNDGFGDYILKRYREGGIDISDVNEIDHAPTTVIFVNRTTGTPEFIPMRGADSYIENSQITLDAFERTKIYHTSCFALSKQPARSAILENAQKAYGAGCQLSIDINYSEKIWPNATEALETIKEYCALQPMVKISQDDIDRLFEKGMNHEEIFTKLHDLGAKLVCLTLGKDGAKLSEKGKPILELSAPKVEKIMDATGAGDAFWSGFLFAWIKEKPMEVCMETALKMAAIKLQNVGRIPDYALIISSILNN